MLGVLSLDSRGQLCVSEAEGQPGPRAQFTSSRTWLSSSGCTGLGGRERGHSSESLKLKSKVGLSLKVQHCGLLLGFGGC